MNGPRRLLAHGDTPPLPRSVLLLPLAIWAAARLVSAAFIILAAPAQPDLTLDPSWHVEGVMPESPSYWQVLGNWDGQWYKTIALHGYPAGAPSGGSQNVFAFYPLFPLTVGLLMRMTGLSFELLGAGLSLIAGGLAAVLLFGWLARTRGIAVALAAVLVLSVFPSAPVLQAAYSDALGMLFLIVCLRAVSDRRWTLLLMCAAVLCLTRPVVLPLAVFVVVTELRRAYAERYGALRLDKRAVLAAVCLSALSFVWPCIVWLRTGLPSAYFDSSASWVRFGGLTGGWFKGMWDMGLKVYAVTAVLIVLALFLLRLLHQNEPRAADGLGTWAPLYMLYILATTTINTSIFRYALLTFLPLGSFGPLASNGLARQRRVVLLCVITAIELSLQWWWVRNVWVVDDSPSLSWPP